MGLIEWLALLNYGEKKWRIGEHRVRSRKKIIPGTAPSGVSDRVAGWRETVYECVDCEKEFESREEFKSEECYEVI